MVVFTSCNNQFYRGLIGLISSFCKNNLGEHNFYIAYNDFSDKNIKKIKRLEANFDVGISFIKINKNDFFQNDSFKRSPRYFWESMIRLLPQFIVPSDCHKAFYIDADIIVNGSLECFYNIDLSNKSIACIVSKKEGSSNAYFDLNSGVYELLKIDLYGEFYFNAGFFLANIDYFRDKITEKTYLDVADKYKENIVFADQCLMNIVFKDTSIKLLDFRFNCCIPPYTLIPKREYRWIKHNIICMHYVTSIKPWHFFRYSSPLIWIYLKYLPLHIKTSLFAVYLFLKPFHLMKKIFLKINNILIGRIKQNS